MKNRKFFTLTAMLFLVAFATYAQSSTPPKVNSNELAKQVLDILENTGEMNLNVNQNYKLKENNKVFVDQLMKISDSSESDESKKSSFLNLKNNRIKFLTSLIGNELTQKYMGNVMKGINPFKSKLGLAALAF
jgi:hypothetical protein